MTPRQRMLTALDNDKPDRLPCQVHGWMDYYLKEYLGGCDWYEAYAKFGMDYAIYVSPDYTYTETSRKNWDVQKHTISANKWSETITTPEGELTQAFENNEFTSWNTEHIIKNKRDFEIWEKYVPLPKSADLTNLITAQKKLGDKGIIRSHPFHFGQGSPWQSLCCLMGMQETIMAAIDEPQWIHYMLKSILEKVLEAAELWEGTPADMIELGGGAASSTVISPDMFREFCLPYDKKQVTMFKSLGLKTVYHLCGGLMPMLDMVVEMGADGLETMTPPSMGGDCDLAKASKQVGDKLFFIGGFDQNAGFENGTPEVAKQLVEECFQATQDNAGYIVAPSDHFFFGNPENIQAFVDACLECEY